MFLCLLGEFAMLAVYFYYFTANDPQKLLGGSIPTIFSHKEQKEEWENVKDWIREKQVAFKNLFKLLKHTVKIQILLQVYFSLSRESKERVCEDRAMGYYTGIKAALSGTIFRIEWSIFTLSSNINEVIRVISSFLYEKILQVKKAQKRI